MGFKFKKKMNKTIHVKAGIFSKIYGIYSTDNNLVFVPKYRKKNQQLFSLHN